MFFKIDTLGILIFHIHLQLKSIKNIIIVVVGLFTYEKYVHLYKLHQIKLTENFC